MRISRKPTGEKFFELFTETGGNIGVSVELLREFVQVPVEQRAELAARMHALENTGDDATHAIIEHLDRSFVTPFDRAVRWSVAADIARGCVLTLPVRTEWSLCCERVCPHTSAARLRSAAAAAAAR
jgi:hypothetical protein